MEATLQKTYEVSPQLKLRINILKGLMPLLIVYIHMYSIDNINYSDGAVINAVPISLSYFKYLISQIIARACVPLFFLISGFLLYRKPFSWRANLRKKNKSILIPYLFWNAAWLLFFFVAQNIEFTAPFFINKVLRNYTLKEWINAFIPFIDYPFLYPFWFLFNLYILNLISPVIKKLIDRLPVATLFALIILWINDVQFFALRSIAILFFSLGYYIVKYNLRIKTIDSIKWPDIGICYLLGIGIELITGGSPLTYRFSVINMFNITVGVIVLIKLTCLVISHEQLTRLTLCMASYSFFNYALHEYTLTIVNKLMVRFVPQYPVILFAEYLLVPVAVTCFCMSVAAGLKRIAPSFYGLITGTLKGKGVEQ